MDGAPLLVGLAHTGSPSSANSGGRAMTDREACFVAAEYLRERLEQEDERPLYDVSEARRAAPDRKNRHPVRRRYASERDSSKGVGLAGSAFVASVSSRASRIAPQSTHSMYSASSSLAISRVCLCLHVGDLCHKASAADQKIISCLD